MNIQYTYAKVVDVSISDADDSVYVKAEKNKQLIGKVYGNDVGKVNSKWIPMDMPLSYLKILGMPEIGDHIRIMYSGNGKPADGTATIMSKPKETNESANRVQKSGTDILYGEL